MADTFKLTYKNRNTGEQVNNEMPRLMISVDGLTKSLFVGYDTVLAAVSASTDDAVLWALAREAVQTLI